MSNKRAGFLAVRSAVLGAIAGITLGTSLLSGRAVVAQTGAGWPATDVPPNGTSVEWPTYTSDDAAFAFDYPPNSVVDVSDDAALHYKQVFVQFPAEVEAAEPANPASDAAKTEVAEDVHIDEGGYAGVSVLVLDNPSNQPVQAFVSAQYATLGKSFALAQTFSAQALTVNNRAALRLERDAVVGDLGKYSVLVPGNGVIYRINLFGGGVGGEVEPTPQTEAQFNQIVSSFRVLSVPLKPAAREILIGPQAADAEPPVATVFTYPLRSSAAQGYGVPTGIVAGGTRMEWLDYGVRNFDQWKIKCYGVDWSRMLHTAEDWYRNDYLTANTAGSPVYAVADGVVERHSPGISYPGNVVLIRHRLPDGRNIYSMYGHITNVSVVQGQQVKRGQQIATVLNQGYVGRTPAKHPTWDSHMHFEMRYFADGTNIYVPGTNAYGYNYPSCTYAYPGRGYTYIVSPDAYPYPNAGYTDPSDFIAARLEGPSGCVPQELLSNGDFEAGRAVWRAVNSANINDPLIYTTRPRTGKWSGWLGNRATYSDTLSQVINVPAGGGTLFLSFWRYVQSKEPAGNGNDKMTVELRDPAGNLIGVQGLVTSAAPRNVWQQELMQFNVSGTNFTTATLRFAGVNNAVNLSSFFLDDISLVKPCPPGTTTTNSAHQDSSTSTSTNLTPAQITGTPTLSNAILLPMVAADVEPVENPNDPDPVKDMAPQACVNVLANGDFEAAQALPWTGIANTSATIYNVIPGSTTSSLKDELLSTTRAHGGAKSGRVGSPTVNGYWNELVQTAVLPPSVASITLTYWRYIDSTETSTTVAYDKFEAGVETARGIQVVPPQKFDNRDTRRSQWVQETLSVPNAAALSGQSVWVTFRGQLDGNQPSSFLVDDIQLNVCSTR